MPVSSSPHGIGKIVQKINEEYNNYSSTVRNDFINNIVNEINNTNYIISGANVDVSTTEYFEDYAPPDLFTSGNLSNTLSDAVGSVIQQDNYLYLTDGAGVVVAFVWDSHAPEGQTQPASTYGGGGDLVFLDPTTLFRIGENATQDGFIEVYDITKPRQINRLGTVTGGIWSGNDGTDRLVNPAVYANNYVYWCDNTGDATRVADCSNRSNPSVSSLPSKTFYARTTAVKDGHLLLSVQDGSNKYWYTYDLTADPVNPTELSTTSAPRRYQNGIVVGDYIYANGGAGGSSDLAVIDISDTENPSEITSKTGSSGTMYSAEITTNGSLLYRMGFSGAIDIWDIVSNPADPQLIHSEAPATTYNNNGCIRDGFLYRMDSTNGVLGTFG